MSGCHVALIDSGVVVGDASEFDFVARFSRNWATVFQPALAPHSIRSTLIIEK